MTHGSLFSGIGGADLAAQWAGWTNVFQVEIDPWCQQLLAKRFPETDKHLDVKQFDGTQYKGAVDVISGGFPCQPYSTAGKRLGKEDDRHLWPDMLRVIREVQPRYVVGENVRGLVTWNGGLVFDEVQAELEAQGYEVTPFLLPACSVNAPHRRDRIWFIAYSDNKRRSSRLGQVQKENGEVSKWDNNAESSNSNNGDASDSSSLRFCQHSARKELFSETFGTQLGMDKQNAANSKSGGEGRLSIQSKKTRTRESNESLGSVCGFSQSNASDSDGIGLRGQGNRIGNSRFSNKKSKTDNWQNFPTVSPICDGDDGFSDTLDSITFPKWRNESIKAGGNAIVPQVVYQIFKAIEQYNQLDKQLSI
jgi:DNA (cytosine-5)-methyltransferase 1